MTHRKSFLIPAAVLTALLLTVSPAAAQYWGGGHWGGGWGGHAWGWGGYPGYGGGWGGWGGYYPVGYSYASNWVYPYRVYGYGPYAFGNPAAAGYSSYYFPAETRPEQGVAPVAYEEEARDNEAHLLVHVPPDAELWFDDKPTRQRGPDREFNSPPLTPGRNYHYDVRARWMENGKPVEATRTVRVRANDRKEVDMTQPNERTTDDRKSSDKPSRDR
jgi:uncharacterized protein (TIGR03000 family)